MKSMSHEISCLLTVYRYCYTCEATQNDNTSKNVYDTISDCIEGYKVSVFEFKQSDVVCEKG